VTTGSVLDVKKNRAAAFRSDRQIRSPSVSTAEFVEKFRPLQKLAFRVVRVYSGRCGWMSTIFVVVVVVKLDFPAVRPHRYAWRAELNERPVHTHARVHRYGRPNNTKKSPFNNTPDTRVLNQFRVDGREGTRTHTTYEYMFYIYTRA